MSLVISVLCGPRGRRVQIDDESLSDLSKTDWFSGLGVAPCSLSIPVQWVASLPVALASLLSDPWADVKTEAQGDLTSFLAKQCAELYGGVWNGLAARVEQRVIHEVMPAVERAVCDWPDGRTVADHVRLDLTRAVLERTYARQVPRVPRFFGNLALVYKSGHLPCGWSADVGSREWRAGTLVAY